MRRKCSILARVRPCGSIPSRPLEPNRRAMNASEPRHLATYRALLDAITTWELRPGQPIPEVEYAKRLGVSRTPLREALRTLADQGLVRIVPGRGAFVAELSVA